MRFFSAILFLALLAPGCREFHGCAELQDHHFRVANRLRAGRAWRSCQVTCDSQASASRHYRRGWIAGYYEVLTGGEALPPVVPPKKYWKPAFQTADGQSAIAEWYNGFQAGALSATSSPFHSEIPLWVANAEPPHMPDYAFPDYAPAENDYGRIEQFNELPPQPATPVYRVPDQQVSAPVQPARRAEPISPAFAGQQRGQTQNIQPVTPHAQAFDNPEHFGAFRESWPISPMHAEQMPQAPQGCKRITHADFTSLPAPPAPPRTAQPRSCRPLTKTFR